MAVPATLGSRTVPAGTDAVVARFESVNKTYGSVRALADFSFDVKAGELVALLGPNGADLPGWDINETRNSMGNL